MKFPTEEAKIIINVKAMWNFSRFLFCRDCMNMKHVRGKKKYIQRSEHLSVEVER